MASQEIRNNHDQSITPYALNESPYMALETNFIKWLYPPWTVGEFSRGLYQTTVGDHEQFN